MISTFAAVSACHETFCFASIYSHNDNGSDIRCRVLKKCPFRRCACYRRVPFAMNAVCEESQYKTKTAVGVHYALERNIFERTLPQTDFNQFALETLK